MLAARRAGADRLVVWSGAAGIAAVVTAARQAGWNVPIMTGQTGEDPLIRQRLVAHPEWLRDVKFVSSRITAEIGPKPFEAFRAHFEEEMGVEKVGVEQDGRPVIQPPDWAMYPYDAVHLVEEALNQREALGAPLLEALNDGPRSSAPTATAAATAPSTTRASRRPTSTSPASTASCSSRSRTTALSGHAAVRRPARLTTRARKIAGATYQRGERGCSVGSEDEPTMGALECVSKGH